MIDFHVHLDLYPEPHLVAKEVAKRGIYVLSVTTTPSAWKGTSSLAPRGSRIRTALGLHPQIAHERASELPLFDLYLSETKYVGEIGLDGDPKLKKHWKVQLKVFDHILNACQDSGGRIMSIHSRRSASSVLDRLSHFPDAGISVLHWFSGSPKELRRAVDMGCWFSIGPAMLRSEKARKLVQEIPRNRLLTETDGPFAQIKGKCANPWDADLATSLLANIWDDIDVAEVDLLLHENLKRLVKSDQG